MTPPFSVQYISCVVPLTTNLQTGSFCCLKLAGVLADSAFLVAMAGRWTRGRSHFVQLLILLPVCAKIAIAGDFLLRRLFSSATTTVGHACWLALSAKLLNPQPYIGECLKQIVCTAQNTSLLSSGLMRAAWTTLPLPMQQTIHGRAMPDLLVRDKSILYRNTCNATLLKGCFA